MGLEIGKVRGFEIKENRDGGDKVLLLQVEVTGPDDIQTVEYYQAAGQDSNPEIDSLVAFLPAGRAWKIALGANDGIEPESDPGEYKIYSSVSGTIKAFFKLLNTGLARIESVVLETLSAGNTKIEAGADIEISAMGKAEITGSTVEVNGNSDFAVRFAALEIQMIALKANLNTHVHDLTTPAPAGNFGGTPKVPFTFDITPAKVTTVKLP
jgi:hypothetical protein